jgi:hypothetical protein
VVEEHLATRGGVTTAIAIKVAEADLIKACGGLG